MKRFADRFSLEREIGVGGMSRVYLARDEVLERPVAVKVLKLGYGETDIGARFRREGRMAASLSHPNIVQVYDAGEDELEGREVSYIVMEYLPGGDLKALVDARGPLPEKMLCRIGADAAAGLAHAHGRGVIHRDIKPHNILLDEAGEPKLADFGIARALDATHATRTGSYLGTALYSSPEQLQGAKKVTPASDVYSLGVTLYHAATGEPPFVGAPIEVASQHISTAPTGPRELNGTVSQELENLILGCLEKDPAARPTAEEVRLALLEAYRGAPAPRAPRSAARPARERRGGSRKRGMLAALALVALFSVVAALALPTLFEGDGGGNGDSAQSDGANRVADGSGGGGGEGSREGSSEGSSEGSGSAAEGGSGGDASRSGPTQRGAVQAVEDFYDSAAEGNYDRSSELLAAEWQQRYFSTRQDFQGTFESLESVRFQGEPTVEVSGDTATVSGETVARHSDRTERNKGTWTLRYRDGRWVITEWSISNISTEPA